MSVSNEQEERKRVNILKPSLDYDSTSSETA
jgi:hypothetical protein